MVSYVDAVYFFGTNKTLNGSADMLSEFTENTGTLPDFMRELPDRECQVFFSEDIQNDVLDP